MNFLRIYIEFQSLQLEITKRSLKHYSSESWTSQKTPWTSFYCCLQSLVAKTGEGERETVIPAMGGLAGGEGGVEEREEIGADL